jgi:hypothetical protein
MGVVKSLSRNTPSSARSFSIQYSVICDHREWYQRREGALVADDLSHRSQTHGGHVSNRDRGSEAPIRRAFPTRFDHWHRASGHRCGYNLLSVSTDYFIVVKNRKNVFVHPTLALERSTDYFIVINNKNRKNS